MLMSGTFCPFGMAGSESVSLAHVVARGAIWRLPWACGAGTALAHQRSFVGILLDTPHNIALPARTGRERHVLPTRKVRLLIRVVAYDRNDSTALPKNHAVYMLL